MNYNKSSYKCQYQDGDSIEEIELVPTSAIHSHCLTLVPDHDVDIDLLGQVLGLKESLEAPADDGNRYPQQALDLE